MKRSMVLFFVLCLQCLRAQSVQNWSSQNGHSFKGTFIRMDVQSVTLRGEDGNEITVPLAALDAKSQDLAKKEQQLAIKNAPAFSHKNRYLRFSIYPKTTWLEVEFLEGPKVVNNETYKVSMTFAEIRPPNKWKSIKIKEMMGVPEKGRNDVTMRLLMENGVKVKFTVDVNDKAEVSYEFEAEEIPDGLPKLDLRTGIRFPKLLAYDMDTQSYKGTLSSTGVKFENLPNVLAGYEIVVDNRDSKNKKVPYYEKQTRGYGAGGFTVKAPGKKDFIFEAPKNSEDGSLYIWFYSGKEPFQGYSIRAGAAKKDNLAAGPFTISVR
ncbi:hypothetical protein P0Y35_10330 [Kiritimatiellaeota bacterium B1221]|nr:hypothetical protein [Kiritimatiellaeota bacterium B1221]